MGVNKNKKVVVILYRDYWCPQIEDEPEEEEEEAEGEDESEESEDAETTQDEDIEESTEVTVIIHWRTQFFFPSIFAPLYQGTQRDWYWLLILELSN